MAPEFTTFEGIKRWLESIPGQIDGPAGPLTEVGKVYQEFMSAGICRPPDVDMVERFVAERFRRQLEEYFHDRSGTIVWRIKFESEIWDFPQIVKYHDDGPDLDVVTDLRCTIDQNWKAVRAYCRLYRAVTPDEPVLRREFNEQHWNSA
jgi:hypothetical protein